MTKTNLVILPSRNRPDRLDECVNLLKINSVISDICVGLDEDNEHLYPRIDGVMYEINPRLMMNGTVNLIANKYKNNYKTFYFLGDDHLVRTFEWDLKLFNPIKIKGYGISYGNDLIQKELLATAVMLSTNIVRSLGYMAPKSLIHLHMDTFWMKLGQQLNALTYVPDVIVEHMHFSVGKSVQDSGYKEVNSVEVSQKDEEFYNFYIKEIFEKDFKKLKYDLGIQ